MTETYLVTLSKQLFLPPQCGSLGYFIRLNPISFWILGITTKPPNPLRISCAESKTNV